MALVSRCRECKKDDKVDNLVVPCSCKGDNLMAHLKCLFNTMKSNGFNECKRCKKPFEGVQIEQIKVNYFNYITDKERIIIFQLGLIMTSFAFYTVFLGFFQYLQSHQILKSIWNFFLFSLVIFFSSIFILIDIYYLYIIHRDFKTWKRNHVVIILKAMSNNETNLTYSAVTLRPH